MRKLVVNAQVTVDGVMQAPGGPEEDPSGGFTHGGWSVGYWDDQLGEAATKAFATPFDLLLGRKTYEIFAAHWPYVTDPDEVGMADILNTTRKYVASTTLQRVDWHNAELLQGDVAQAVARLKQEDGPQLLTQGSSNLIQTLLEHDLVDEFSLAVFPVVLGSGKRLFGSGTMPSGLRLTDTVTTSSGVVVATYERAGEVKTGSFALEDPTEAEIARRQRDGA